MIHINRYMHKCEGCRQEKTVLNKSSLRSGNMHDHEVYSRTVDRNYISLMTDTSKGDIYARCCDTKCTYYNYDIYMDLNGTLLSFVKDKVRL